MGAEICFSKIWPPSRYTSGRIRSTALCGPEPLIISTTHTNTNSTISTPRADFAHVLMRYPKQVKIMRSAIIRAKLRSFCHSLLHLDEADRAVLQSILTRKNPSKSVRSGAQLMTMSQQMAALREENSSLKNMVQRIEQTMEDQKQTLEDQQQTLEVMEKMMKEKQERMEQVLKETLAQQQKELVALFHSSNGQLTTSE